MATVIRQPGEGRALWFLGGLYDLKVTGEDTGGELSSMEVTLPPGPCIGAPPHVHPGGEVAYVLEGDLLFHVDGKEVKAGPGTLFYFQKGTEEWFENVGKKQARLLVVYTPGGLDRFFEEVAEPARARRLPPAPKTPPDFERIASTAAKYGVQVKPPPAPAPAQKKR